MAKTTTRSNTMESIKDKISKATEDLANQIQYPFPHQGCPNCGYCPTCGRSNNPSPHQQWPTTWDKRFYVGDKFWSNPPFISN